MQNIVDFRAQNPKDWKNLIDQLFPLGVPARAIWVEQETIIRVLNHIGGVYASNYTFLPSTGGLDLTGAKVSSEAGLMELVFGQSARVGKIESLSFESFGDTGDPEDYQWAYFRIETEPLAPTGIGYVPSHQLEERVTELRPGEYASLDAWEYRGEQEDEDPLPKTARPLTRLLGGSLVIFQKSGDYNAARGTDGAVHNLMDADDFRDFIATARYMDLDKEVMRVLQERKDA